MSHAEVEAVLARLGPDARSAMLDALIEAAWEAEAVDDVRPVLSVIRTWYVDTRVVSRPGFSERLKQSEGQAVTQEDLLLRIGSSGS